MYIKRICYPVKTLGPGNRIGIWVTGCEKNCFGCMSPDLRIKEDGSDISVSKLMHMFQAVEKPIAGFTISGGEPFLQEEELCKLITEIVNNFSDDIIIYTGYTLHELELKKSVHINRILELISVLIDGEYVDSLNDGKGLRGSSSANFQKSRAIP